MIVQLRLMEQACVRLLIYGARPRQGLKVRARLGRRRVAEFNNKTKRPKTASNLKCFQYNYLPTAVSPRQLKPQQLSSRLNLLSLGFLAQGLGPGPGARVWGLARCFRLCLRHSGAKYLPPRPRTCTDCGLQRSRHEAPTDGARLRLSYGARCRQGLKVRAHLCLRHSGADCLPPRPRTWTDCGPQWSHHVQLRLMEQACECCTMRGGGGVKVGARLCL